MVQASDTLQNILEEATAKRGLDFTFQEPLWGTWPMARFGEYHPRLPSSILFTDFGCLLPITVEKSNELIPQYDLSTSHLRLLMPVLLRSGEPKVARGPTSKSSSASGADEANVDFNATRRQAYDAWIALPYLSTQGLDSLVWFESLCEVEVGRWRE